MNLQIVYPQYIIFAPAKRKRTQALLGSNLSAILFADTLYKERLSGLPFTYTVIQYGYRKPNV